MREQLPEYTYTNNEKTFTEVMIGFVRGILETVFPFFRIKPFSILLDKLFASKFADSLLGAFAMVMIM